MTKLVTSAAAMQLVERGLIGLDDDAGQHVPYLADVQVLSGFDDAGNATLEKRTQPITLRYDHQNSSLLSLFLTVTETSSPTLRALPTTPWAPSSSGAKASAAH